MLFGNRIGEKTKRKRVKKKQGKQTRRVRIRRESA